MKSEPAPVAAPANDAPRAVRRKLLVRKEEPAPKAEASAKTDEPAAKESAAPVNEAPAAPAPEAKPVEDKAVAPRVPETQPETKLEEKPETKPEAKPESKAETKPETKPEPARSSDVPAAEAKPTTTETKPVDKPVACGDEDAKKLNVELLNILRSSGKGQLPAIAYEQTKVEIPDGSGAVRGFDVRARQQAHKLSEAAIGAFTNKQSPGSGAASRIFNDPDRRASTAMYTRCQNGDEQPRPVLTDAGMDQSALCIDRATHERTGKDVGLNATQIYVTNNSPEDVYKGFIRLKLGSADPKNTVGICDHSPEQCRDPKSAKQNYKTMSALWIQNQDPKPGSSYFVSDKVNFGMFGVPYIMENRSEIKVSGELSVCGGKAYVVTAINNGHSRGFDYGTLAALVVRVGDKTVVIGDFSAQSFSGIPRDFPYSAKEFSEFMTRGYNKLADTVGADERVENGRIEGTTGSPSNHRSGGALN